MDEKEEKIVIDKFEKIYKEVLKALKIDSVTKVKGEKELVVEIIRLFLKKLKIKKKRLNKFLKDYSYNKKDKTIS